MSNSKTLLQISASLFSAGGQSSQLAQRYVDSWRQRHPDGRVIVRDLAAEPVPHLTADGFLGFLAEPAARSASQRQTADLSDALVAELLAADEVVIGMPMYNFTIPSTLKAYFDHIARPGLTFRYGANGPEGLLSGKRTRIFSARGGAYAGTPADTETAYVRQFLSFLGLSEIDFVYAENLKRSEEAKQAGLAAAVTATDQLAA